MSSTDDPDFDSVVFRLVVEHVFMPPKLPQKEPDEQIVRETNVALCDNLIRAAQDFLQAVPSSEHPLWMNMINMIELARHAAAAEVSRKKADLQHVFSNMASGLKGDVFSMHIRAQNAALIVRRLSSKDFIQFEVFEVSPQNTDVMTTNGKLRCSYPGPAIRVPTEIFRNECFLRELCSFLVQMDDDDRLNSTPTTSKGGSDVYEVRETVDPKYISQLLMGILRGYGQPADVDRFTKRIGDEVLWDNTYKPWRRSPLWLTIRVSLQSSLRASNLYKSFILFFHAHLLRNRVARGFSSELLYAMGVKTARRLSKLGPAVSQYVYKFVHDTFEGTEAFEGTKALLSKRWTIFHAEGLISPTFRPEELNFISDTDISLHNSYDYLENMLHSASHGLPQTQFIPSQKLRLNNVRDFTQFTNGRFASAFAKDQRVAISDFELSVEKNLKSWFATSINDKNSPNVVASCIQLYRDGAEDLYGTNAEDISIMILTIMDLWVALDKVTIRQCPLLKEYSPEIPSDFLHPLLLHRSSTLRRASCIEEYLRQRHNEASNAASIFSNNISESSFAVQYFHTSEDLKRINDEIVADAQEKRVKKGAELQDLNQRSDSLILQASRMDHESKSTYWGKIHRSESCQRCRLEDQAKSMKICVHEWPLPLSTLDAQQAVFELSPPHAFSAWRDTTYMILRDLGLSTVPDSCEDPKIGLGSFSGLSSWAVQRQSRLIIGSITKSFADQTHYQTVGIPAAESSVLVNNGLSFRLFDNIRESRTIDPLSASNVTELCTPPIPTSSPYRHLHRFVSGTEHTPNNIIASQADCPEEITLHEFLAFSGLRSGPRLQWLNIAREIASPFLSFRREEVHTLVTQAAWQLGPLLDGVREWHIDLNLSGFGNTLLRELESLLKKIGANWLEEVTVRTIALITSRLLASTEDSDISSRACALLREIRNLTYQWISDVGDKLKSTNDEIFCAGLRRRLCILAATCFSTFDVCSEHVLEVLATEEDFSIAMQCAVIVHDNTPPSFSGVNSHYLSRMLSRHHRLLHHLEPTFSQSTPGDLSEVRLLHEAGYDNALKKLWLGYRRRISTWHTLSQADSRWITCIAKGGLKVHYDLLTGKLLVDGKPLGRVPQEIAQHPAYASVLGTKILDVGPAADVPGMDYMSRSTVSGYQILFSWNDGDLILGARMLKSSRILYLIPRAKLLGDFPRQFVDQYVHWLDLVTREVEFRPAGSPWTPESSNWRLYFHEPGIHPRATFRKGNSSRQLIDIRSRTFEIVSSLLSPLESPELITVTHASYALQPLKVFLPRFQLSFFVNSNWELQCQSIPGYVVDKNQSCGTMFGLRNKLVLCPMPNSSGETLLLRRVIIPQGDISFRTDGNFTSVSINTNAEKHVRWHEYTIDTDLGCLKSNTSLRSKLYQCYLHALTSHCLPDPLLGHTGTEEALYMLRGAAFRSFQRLDSYDANLLESISKLTPDRVYYPPHLQSMATVLWNDLPSLSQHHDFYWIVCSILDHARALEALHDPPAVFNTPDRNELLLKRATSRNMPYYPSDFQILEKPSSLHDIEYRSRDISGHGTAEHIAYQTSWSIWNARPSLDRKLSNLWDLMNLWPRDSVGPARSLISLRYSRYWLEFDAARDWFVIYDLCRKVANGNSNSQNSRIELSFSLSAAAYSESKYADIVPILVIFALDDGCCDLIPPAESSYKLSDGVAPGVTHLKDLVFKSRLRMELTPACSFGVGLTNWRDAHRLRMAEYYNSIKRESLIVANSILHHWPDYESVDFREQWFNKSECNQRIKEYLQSISRNISLENHVLQLQSILQRHIKVSIPAPAVPYVVSPQFIISDLKAPSYSIRDVLISHANVPNLSSDVECFPFPSRINPLAEETESCPAPARLDALKPLIEEFCDIQKSSLLQLYGNELSKSHRAWLGKNASQSTRVPVPSHELLRRYHDGCFHRKNELFSEILAALSPSQDVEKIIGIAGLWPRITPRSILSQLAQDRIGTLDVQWKIAITCYAVSLLKYQQSRRLLELLSGEKQEELLREIDAISSDVLAESTPDWLLVQIEANLVARPAQVAVAREMISPSAKQNISLQLNMGEGKSSVIVPLVASTLADGSKLVRVVTLRPLSSQMFQLLVSRLSGLLNRPIFYIPFSRSLCMDTSLVNTISRLYRRCADEGGILVVQPEHVLSQKLMHVDFLLTSHENGENHSVAQELGVLQDWVTKSSRDVLDESDEILHVRYQLVYTAGKQKPVDDHPNRWTIIQQVFSMLQAHAATLHDSDKSPQKIEYDTTLRGFPIIRILDSAIFREISSLIIRDVSEGRLSNLQLRVLPIPVLEATCRFMAQREVSSKDYNLIRSHCEGKPLFKGILLLRGLLMDGDGILGYVLKERRWRVDYGLDPSRTLLAVPYRAKDVPSLRAEFGHPDVAIALTCLSYYYGGITKSQLLLCFELLAKLDDGKTEYEDWVLGQDLPEEFRQLNGVNTEDETQVDKVLVPKFSKNKRVVDFYLSHVVFPRAAREFPSKLPTSAWDLVEDKKNITTGFSGTNDNRHLLPTSITQEDPDFVLGTNALVLQNLLLPENDHYECIKGANGERESATAFLERLVNQDPEIRVLLDVGAQMLELQNEELARHWLSLRPDVSAGIFFNDSDHLTVITRDGTIEPLISSPFNRQLEKCVVYLDDTHTRGTDIKFPRGMRAAVTLGPKVTKDRLVQGCMRMRQLGNGHSVMFFAPREVERRIRGRLPSGTASEYRIRVLDILRWAMRETCEDIRRHLPHWVQQGLDHHKRFAAYKEHRSPEDLEALKDAWLQRESRTLEEMYGVTADSDATVSPEIGSIPSLSERIERLGLSATKSVDVRMTEEQEREVDHEVEQEPQVMRPPKAKPAPHDLKDICKFVSTGKVPQSSLHTFPILRSLDMAEILNSAPNDWSPSPLATTDFSTTVLDSDPKGLTLFLRPVNWILSSGSGRESTVVVISPYEANELLPIIRKTDQVRLHVYAPRVTSSMRSFSDLTFHTIPNSGTESLAEQWSAPAHIRTELNLFAGQLYFDNREEYKRMCVLLALTMEHPRAECEIDGFVPPAHRRPGEGSPLVTSKIAILKELIGLRRKGMGYSRTHLGQILNANPLSEETLPP